MLELIRDAIACLCAAFLAVLVLILGISAAWGDDLGMVDFDGDPIPAPEFIAQSVTIAGGTMVRFSGQRGETRSAVEGTACYLGTTLRDDETLVFPLPLDQYRMASLPVAPGSHVIVIGLPGGGLQIARRIETYVFAGVEYTPEDLDPLEENFAPPPDELAAWSGPIVRDGFGYCVGRPYHQDKGVLRVYVPRDEITPDDLALLVGHFWTLDRITTLDWDFTASEEEARAADGVRVRFQSGLGGSAGRNIMNIPYPRDAAIYTNVHEGLHVLGLSHPGLYNGDIDLDGEVYSRRDCQAYSRVSYSACRRTKWFDAWSARVPGFSHVGPQIDDIAVIERLGYELDPEAAGGPTTWLCNATLGGTVFDLSRHAPLYAIHDMGGDDTLDASCFGTADSIDMRPYTLSSIGQWNGEILTNNIGISHATMIENVLAGPGNDRIIANAAPNVIDGGDGEDTVVLDGARSSYAVTQETGFLTVGDDTLISVEWVQFENELVAAADLMGDSPRPERPSGMARDDLVRLQVGARFEAVDVLANDLGDGLVIVSVERGAPLGAKVSGDGLRIYVRPVAGWVGTDSVSYTVRSPSGAEGTATLTVTVQ